MKATIRLTRVEWCDLCLLRDRLESNVMERVIAYEPIGPVGFRLTDDAREAARVLPVIKRLLESAEP